MKASGIIGVIVVTIIVIIVAAFTFAHVESIREQQLEKKNRSVQGWVQYINESGTISVNEEVFQLYEVTLSNTSGSNESMTYRMIFDGAYPPFYHVSLQFYYDPFVLENETFYKVTFIEQIS